MASIQDFVQMAVSSVGVDQSVAEKATGGLLGFLKQSAEPGVFDQLARELPGAANLIPGDSAESSGGGGLLGAVSKLTGGFGGGTGGLVGVLTDSGLELGKADDFLGLFANFAKANLSGDLIGKISDKIPHLKNLIG